MTTPLKKPKDGTNPDRADTVPRQAVAGSIGSAERNTAMMQNRIAEMEAQLQALEQLRPLLSSLQDQAERLEGTQRRTDVRLDRAAESADNIQGQMEELSHSTDMALSLKKDITRFEHLIPETKEHLGDLETLSTQVSDHVKAFQKRRDAIGQAVDAAKDLDKVLQHIEVVATKQQEQAETADQLEDSLKSLQAEITDRSAEIRSRQVQLDAQDQATLEELAAIRAAVRKSLEQVDHSNKEFESVGRRIVELRSATEDLGRQFIALDESKQSVADIEGHVKELSTRMRTIADGSDWIEKIETSVEDVRTINAEVLDRSAEVIAKQREIEDGVKAALESLETVHHDIEKSAEGVEITNRRFDSVSRHTANLREALEDFETRLGGFDETRDGIADLQAQAESLADRLSTLSDGDGGLTQLDARMTDAEDRQREVTKRAEQISSHQQEIDDEAEAVRDQLSSMRAEVEANAERIKVASRSANMVSQRIDKLDEPLKDAEDRLRDLEGTRQAIADVGSQTDALSDRLHTIAAGDGGVSELQSRLQDMKSHQVDIVNQSENITARHEEIAEGADAAREQLAGLREDVEKNVERVDIATHEFESLGTQFSGLRQELNDFETRLSGLHSSRQAIMDVQKEADDLSARIVTIVNDCRLIDGESERIRSLHLDVDRIDGAVSGIEGRVEGFGAMRDEVDAVSRNMAELKRTDRALTNSLEQAQLAHDEIIRMRDGQSKTERWFTEVQESLEKLRTSVTEVDELKPTVVSVREEAERVGTALTTIDSRRELLEDLDRRLGELESLGTRLEYGEGAKGGPQASVGGRTSWHFGTNVSVDRSTWEFGLQLRFAGRWKRGVAIWLGPLRWFIGWEKLMGPGEQGEDPPVPLEPELQPVALDPVETRQDETSEEAS